MRGIRSRVCWRNIEFPRPESVYVVRLQADDDIGRATAAQHVFRIESDQVFVFDAKNAEA